MSIGSVAKAAGRLPKQRALSARLVVVIAKQTASIVRLLLSKPEALRGLPGGIILLVVAE